MNPLQRKQVRTLCWRDLSEARWHTTGATVSECKATLWLSMPYESLKCTWAPIAFNVNVSPASAKPLAQTRVLLSTTGVSVFLFIDQMNSSFLLPLWTLVIFFHFFTKITFVPLLLFYFLLQNSVLFIYVGSNLIFSMSVCLVRLQMCLWWHNDLNALVHFTWAHSTFCLCLRLTWSQFYMLLWAVWSCAEVLHLWTCFSFHIWICLNVLISNDCHSSGYS